jgi:hypothetical protein
MKTRIILLISFLVVFSHAADEVKPTEDIDVVMIESEFTPPTRRLDGMSFLGYELDTTKNNFAGYDTTVNPYKDEILARLIANNGLPDNSNASAAAPASPAAPAAPASPAAPDAPASDAQPQATPVPELNGNNRLLRPWQVDDDAKMFFKTDPYEVDLTKLPVTGKAKNTVWSGYYWAIRYGVGSLRYSNDPTVNTMFKLQADNTTWDTRTWQESTNMYKQPTDYATFIATGGDTSEWVAKYASPTEMYDLLVGDPKWTLTNYYKALGNSVRKETNGDIATWMGICHGWSVAAYMEPKPMKSVTLTAADGKTKIKFKPHDIMAITSMYWANAKFYSNFAGYMCDQKTATTIEKDPITGIYLNYSCFSFNPGSFHIILANQMGTKGQSFVFDPDNTDYQIWNFPLSDYKFDYYQPTTKVVKAPALAAISIEDCAKFLTTNKDPFLQFVLDKKNANTKYIVGVRVTFNYAVEKMPDNYETATGDLYTTSTLFYYLEIASDYKILGGEWRALQHPNYAWGPYRTNDEYLMAQDKSFTTFAGVVADLTKNMTNAQTASAEGRPLRALMKYLTSQAATA